MRPALLHRAGSAAACALVAGASVLGGSLQPQAGTRDVYVSAVDRRGAPVPGLAPADFVVREGGVAREVLSVRPAEERLHIVLLVDNSEIATPAISYLRDGLVRFLERVHGRAEVALMTTGDRPTLVAPSTADTSEVQREAGRLFQRSGAGAYLLDAIVEASRALGKREAARPVIVALTLEGPEFSNQHHTRVLEELQASGAALHVLAIGTPSDSLNDEMRNRNLVIAEGTARTGGRRDQVLAHSGIPDRLVQVADELVNQYLLTYASPDRLVPAEKLDVSSTRRDVTVRARTRIAPR